MALILSLFLVVFIYCYSKFKNPVFAASIFTSLEILKGVIFTGFPWGDLSYNFYEFQPFLKVVPYLGSYFITFTAILVNVSIFNLFSHKNYRSFIYIGVLVVLIGVLFFIPKKNINENQKVNISIIQGNVSEDLIMDSKRAEDVLNIYKSLTLDKLKYSKPDLVVWGETIFTKFIDEDKNLKNSLLTFISKINTNLILGMPSIDFYSLHDYKIFNSLYFFDKTANFMRYDKIHLVPFGEYTPLKFLFGFVNKISPGEDFSKGKVRKILKYDNLEIVPLVCFEGIFPFEIAESNKMGGNIIINISNEAWFGKSNALWQHLAANVFRAAESGKFFIKSANTGISAVISPDGEILRKIYPFESGFINMDIPLVNGVSFYHQYCYLINIFYLLVVLSGFIYTIFFAKRRDRAI